MMPSFEQEVKDFLTRRHLLFRDHTSDFGELDFEIEIGAAPAVFWLDVKEKMQTYTIANWPEVEFPENDLFILDDLGARKVLQHAPNSAVAIRDNPGNRYSFLTAVDMFLMPKKRVNRKIQKNVVEYKGKWLINLRNGKIASNVGEVISCIEQYIAEHKKIFSDFLPCYGDYLGERIDSGGITRRPEHWEKDVSSTR
jgi:hypothetical protein